MRSVALLFGFCLIIAFAFFNPNNWVVNANGSTDLSYAFDGDVSATFLTKSEMELIEGEAAPLIAVVVLSGGRMIVQRWVSTRAAAAIVRSGGNVWAPTRQSANAIARYSSKGRPIREFHSGKGQRFTHFHTNPRNGSHVWYGSARTYGFGGSAAWGSFSGSSFFGGASGSAC